VVPAWEGRVWAEAGGVVQGLTHVAAERVVEAGGTIDRNIAL